MKQKTHTATRVAALLALTAILLVIPFLSGCTASQSSDAKTYETTLFDSSFVHAIEITMDESDWLDLQDNALDKVKYEASVVIDGEEITDAKVSTKGSNSLRSVAKKKGNRYSLKLKMGGEGYRGLKKLNLNNNSSDPSLMKDHVAYQLFSKMNVPAPLSSYAWVTVNGKAYGLFLAVEEVDENFLSRNFDGQGQLYKPEDSTLTAKNEKSNEAIKNGATSDSNHKSIDFADSLDEYCTGADLVYTDDSLSSYPDIFNNTQTDADDKDQQRVISALKNLAEDKVDRALDEDEVMRYFVAHTFACNYDSYIGKLCHNYFLYENDGRLSMLPWDYNWNDSMCTNENADEAASFTTEHINVSIDNPLRSSLESRPMWAWITKSDDRLAQYHQLYGEFLTSCIESGWANDEIVRVEEMIADYVAKDPTFTYTAEEHKAAVEDLQAFFSQRSAAISGQLGL